MAVNPQLPSEDEAQGLAMRVAQGDRSAENQIVRRYAGRLMAMAMVRTRNREVAAELVDDVLMATISAIRGGSVHDTARLGAFIYGTAVNLINNFLRSDSRHPRPEPLLVDVPDPNAAESLERNCDLALMRRTIAHLDSCDREVLVLTLVEGLEPEDIAQRTGLSHSAVRQRKSRAIRRLRQAMSGESRDSRPGPHN